MNLIKWLKDLFSTEDNRPVGLKQIEGNNKILQTTNAPLFNKQERAKISDLIKGEIYQ